MNFFFDEHIPSAVARGLQRRGLDGLTVQTAGRTGRSDQALLEFATSEGRVLFTFDDDFLQLAAGQVVHAGILFCSANKFSIGELIHAILLVNDIIGEEDMKNHIEFL